jgi:hypothetical protein
MEKTTEVDEDGTYFRIKSLVVSIMEFGMGKGLLLWLIGIPIPIILLIWIFGGFH